VEKEQTVFEGFERLSDCTFCPRECHANRLKGPSGYCHTDAGFHIASIVIHKGEEPVIGGEKGICNIFFTGCNLRCIYCQNHQISRNCDQAQSSFDSLPKVLDCIGDILDQGIRAVGLVSPSHVVPQAFAIIRGLHERGRHPVIVWNTNGYEKAETIHALEGLVDVYLPDFKYIHKDTAARFSDAPDYPEIAANAIRTMYYQKGSVLSLSDDGQAENGLLIRHLVLPGHVQESIDALRFLADEISTGIHISLMSQYYPTPQVMDKAPLNRTLYREEYEKVVEEMYRLGFRNGWIQEMDSEANYRPDFRKTKPFR